MIYLASAGMYRYRRVWRVGLVGQVGLVVPCGAGGAPGLRGAGEWGWGALGPHGEGRSSRERRCPVPDASLEQQKKIN